MFKLLSENDLLDRIVRVVDRNGYATTYEYDANGNRTAVHYANGYTTTYEYDLLNRLIRLETIDSDTNVVVQYIYTLGAAGERLSVTESDRTVEYTYDSLYRLTSETITDNDGTTVYTYAYDNVSNRTLKTVNGDETVYTYNELNQLISDSETSYEYDLNGNLVRVIGSDRSALYEYNSENKLVKATVQQGDNVVVEAYSYDYAGNRTSKTTHKSNGEVEYTKYLNDTNSDLTNVLIELDENGTVKCAYTLGADLISQEIDGKTYTYVYDGHGSIVGLADESGKVTDTYVYDAFGNLLKSTGSTANNYLYCGEQFDSTTGLYYLRARYMDTVTGRFISQDTYQGDTNDPVSLHKYLYCNSDPVNNIDPSGYMALANTGLLMAIQSVICSIAVSDFVYAIMGAITGIALGIIGASIGLFDNIEETSSDIASGDLDSNDISGSVQSEAAAEANYIQSIGWLGILLITVARDISSNQEERSTHDHHIVMRNHHYHEDARMLLDKAKIGIDDRDNIVTIKVRLHRAIHSMKCQWIYSRYVYDELFKAYWVTSNFIYSGNKNLALRITLNKIGSELLVIDAMI